jgi:glycosyltransferase involved in cell wall biosynthesis
MLARADLVFATSETLAQRLRAHGARALHTVPNVAEVALFARAHEPLPEPEALRGLPHPRAIYVGNLAGYRVDFALLERLARDGVSLVLVGPAGLGDPGAAPAAAAGLAALPNVRALGPQPRDALPALLRHADVALVPFLDNAHTRGSFPLKVWEYLAAGLPVVATPLPNLRALAGEGVLALAAEPDAFAAAVRAAAAGDGPQARRARLERARAHDWPARMDELCEAVGRALASPRGAPTLRRGGEPPHQ